jgi:hypothetical protein
VQLEDLLVTGAEPSHRGGHVRALHHVVAGVRHVRGELSAQPVAQRGPATLAPPVVREHPSRHAVEPRPHVVTLGHMTQPPPRDQERVGGDITGILGPVDAAQREAQDSVEVRGVQVAEGALALVEREGHVTQMSGTAGPVAADF